ncbi:MAG: hypothetical protein GY849_18960, partial [Deltaproteobacteria bacterium]|nr:hypothetical protein [Deltaproteobacteria bacterium]
MSNVPECSFCGENKIETVLFLTEENGPMICLSCVQGFLAINQERKNNVLKRRKKSCSGVL